MTTDRSVVDRMIAGIIRREGGYVDHPADGGGPTRDGITLKMLQSWRRRPVTADDIKRLGRAEIIDIYYAVFIKKPGFYLIDHIGLRVQLIDAGVTSGPARVIRWLQKIVGDLKVDGRLGPLTAEAVNRADARTLNNAFMVRRLRFMAGMAQRDANAVAAGRLPSNESRALFVSGWITRSTGFLL